MRHTGVVHEGEMEEVQDAMSCERANNKPQVRLNPATARPMKAAEMAISDSRTSLPPSMTANNTQYEAMTMRTVG